MKNFSRNTTRIDYVIGIDEVGRAAPKRRASPTRYVIGIDEVGRGSLAGPVTVAAMCMPANLRLKTKNLRLGKLRDSKKLTAKQREAWAAYFKNHPRVRYAIARVYPRSIERINISAAANVAAQRAFKRLMSVVNCQMSDVKVFLDGGLYLGRGEQPKNARTIIKGDEKINAVKLASIIAKVHRDRLMVRLAKKYSEYGFEIHKGYGTRAHMRAVKRHGPSKAHRLTFLKSSAKI